MRTVRYLADVNVLIALTNEDHVHHKTVTRWFNSPDNRDWGVCALSEAGFLRIASNPKVGGASTEEATEVLVALSHHAGYRYWPIAEDWAALSAPFRSRVFGHQQVTDAYLLGLAVKENGVLVTMDKAILYLAGVRYSKHVLILE